MPISEAVKQDTVEYNVPQPISLKKLAWVYVIEITCLASYYIYQDRKISAEIKALRIRETILKAFNNFGIFVPVPVKDKPGPQQPQ
ncbi:hypothetical protein ATZ36_06255 [Candidatus Endomicrobiellum trichonymphae]|uniref:Uncharacterized protein n=1 Tax=Endomicrobium trichonymphae TaxID=1408204 RepID=A0A1E5IHX3_ENDTX|nr:hypothetical protein ATZ36_06255 [Candidatus Endomicrobium trichonymphae]